MFFELHPYPLIEGGGVRVVRSVERGVGLSLVVSTEENQDRYFALASNDLIVACIIDGHELQRKFTNKPQTTIRFET